MKQQPKNYSIRRWFRAVLPVLLTLLALVAGAQNSLAQSTVMGRVTNSEGEPIAGAIVAQQGSTSNATMSDTNGDFSIRLSAVSNQIIVSFYGYVTQTVTVDGSSPVSVILQEDAQQVEEVVVVGFGKQKKESVVGAVSTISPKELKIPSSNISNAFAGRLSGVIAVQRSGEPGADGSSFWIRGISTFTGSTTPLIFIDGVESSTYDMNSLAPEVIEGFSVLKDATATALYGARGANGVMLITTRQGSNMERAKINIRVEAGMTQPTKSIELADGVDYMIGFNEALTTRGAARNIYFSDYKIEQTRLGSDPLVFPNIDWQDFLFNDWAYNQTGNINVQGGGSKVTYFMSASFNNDSGMLKSDPNNSYKNNITQQRYSIQGNIAANLTPSTKITVRLNSNIRSLAGSSSSAANIYGSLFNSPGVLFPAYYPGEPGDEFTRFGNVLGGPHMTGDDNASNRRAIYYNVYATMVSGYKQLNENTSMVSFEFDQKMDFLTEGLSFNAMYSFKNWSQTNVTRSFVPVYFQRSGIYDEYTPNAGGGWDYTLERINQGRTSLGTSAYNQGDRLMNLQAQINWTRSFDRHNVSAMAIYLMRDYNNNVPGIKSNGDSYTESERYYNALPTRNQGLGGRITYDYDSRYLFEFNFGYNGSENFAEGRRFGFFPSVGVGYNISRENFWKPLSGVVSGLKIYGSVGLVGNAATDSRFPYLTKVNLSGRSYAFGFERNESKSGAAVNVYGAAGARWETGLKANVGIDVNLFNSLNLIVEAYRERRKDIFMRYETIPVESGIASDLRPYANLGVVKNEGVDVTLNYDKAFRNGLILNVRGTVTYSKNTLVDRDVPANMPAHRNPEGRSLNLKEGLIALGLFIDEADIANSPKQSFGDPLPGDIKYLDLDGNGMIDGNDRTYIGKPTIPQLVYGFGASAQYKGFDASFFFQGVGRTSLMMGDIHPFGNQYTQMFKFIADDYWTEDNPNQLAKYPRLVSGTAPGAHNNHQASTYWLRDNWFLRLKNVEVGYTYKFARLYLSGQNLFTISAFKHWDPEVGDGRGLSYPPLRTFMMGVQLAF